MDKLKTSDLGGFPLVLDDFREFLGRLTSPANHGIYQAFNNILGGFGTDFIIQGCVLSGSTGAFSITEGWILLGGELIKVDAQGPFDEAVDGTFTKVTTFDPRGTKTFLNASVNETYEKNRGVISGLAGTLNFDGIRFAEMRIAEKGSSTVVLKKKVIEIGDWNMDSDVSKLVNHGISVATANFRNVSVMIIDDAGIVLTPLNFTSSGSVVIQGGIGIVSGGITATVNLFRLTGGVFDSTNYNATSFNRGWITIEYEA